ncbi:MAG: hypothetical protein Q9208_006586 [Pyrenodesmia sp. 3 TL-2023]
MANSQPQRHPETNAPPPRVLQNRDINHFSSTHPTTTDLANQTSTLLSELDTLLSERDTLLTNTPRLPPQDKLIQLERIYKTIYKKRFQYAERIEAAQAKMIAKQDELCEVYKGDLEALRGEGNWALRLTFKESWEIPDSK